MALLLAAVLLSVSMFPTTGLASSHQDAPFVTLDPAANTTDVYAFVAGQGNELNLSLAVYPHEEPGIGPNRYNFDDNVRYEIHLATGNDIAAGRATFTYRFEFTTRFKSTRTILQSYLGVIQNVDDAAQNLTQTYSVTKIDDRNGKPTVLGENLLVPPNNQGRATPLYNKANNGDNPAKDGVNRGGTLDRYTAQTIHTLADGSRVFAGQREDGFYADINAIFDLLSLRGGAQAFDSQGGFNVHEISLTVPISTIGGTNQVVGVYTTTSRRKTSVLKDDKINLSEGFVQVGRQGNPLFCEGLVAIEDKDLYNRTSPVVDAFLFRKYAESPELAKLINALVFQPLGIPPLLETGRTDLVGIFIPDLIKVDLSTGAARLAGGGSSHPTTPDDVGYSRLGIFGAFVPGEAPDTLTSRIAGQGFLGNGTLPGGWPNGRRFGDDVVDIAILALASDLRNPAAPQIPRAGIPAAVLPALTDGMNKNDSVYNKVFPYAGTPHNGRAYRHNLQQAPLPPEANSTDN
jgi:hypothetical protein